MQEYKAEICTHQVAGWGRHGSEQQAAGSEKLGGWGTRVGEGAVEARVAWHCGWAEAPWPQCEVGLWVGAQGMHGLAVHECGNWGWA